MTAEQIEKMKAYAATLVKQQDAVYNNLVKMTEDPMPVQTKFLLQNLQDNKDTEYGKKYDFANIKTIEDYQKKVPITDFTAYVPFIDRMVKGERNLTTAYELEIYNKSSGTSGEMKKIPMTKKASEVFYRYTNDLQSGVLRAKGIEPVSIGAMIMQITPELEILEDGVPYGSLSDSLLHTRWDAVQRTTVSLKEAVFAKPGTNTRYIQARSVLASKELSRITCSFVSYILDFFRYIEHNWQLVIKDMRQGTIDESIEMDEDTRQSLLKQLKPMPERADELEAIFSQGFESPFAKKVWPKLSYIAGAMTGSFKEFSMKLRERYIGPDVDFFCRGVSASEGSFSQPLDVNSYDSVLLPDSVFYEFLPQVDGKSDLSNPLTLDKLQVGENYELVVTNLSGFYRYRMGDVFEVKGMYNKTPLVEFAYRANKTVDLVTERTTEQMLLKAAALTAQKCGYDLVNSSLYPDTERMGYTFYIEMDRVPQNLTEQQVRDTLESSLIEVNTYIEEALAKKELAPVEVHFSQPETAILYREMVAMRGAAIGQQKPVTVISTEAQRKFFNGLTDSLDEIKAVCGCVKNA